MNRILLLTTNVLAEEEMQQELHRMNYEVLASASYFTQLNLDMPIKEELSGFQLILFSQYLSDNEIETVLPLLVGSEQPLLQVVTQPTETLPTRTWREEATVQVVSLENKSRHLKEAIDRLLHGSLEEQWLEQRGQLIQPEKVSLFRQLSFSNIERQIIEILYQAQGSLVTKEDLSELIWGQPLTKSRVVQIYTNISRIKEKIEELHPNKVFIGAQRGVGYFLTDLFYQFFDLGEPVYTLSEDNSDLV